MGSKKTHKERKRSKRDRRSRSRSSTASSRSESEIYERRRKRPHREETDEPGPLPASAFVHVRTLGLCYGLRISGKLELPHDGFGNDRHLVDGLIVEDGRSREESRKESGKDRHEKRRGSPSEEHLRLLPDNSRYASYRDDKAEQRKRDEEAERRVAKERTRSATPEGPSQERELTPEIDDGREKLSMSIEETNRLRAKLGLKPLQVENDGEKKSEENKEVFVKTENISEKKEAEAFRDKVRTMREKQQFKQKYEKVRTLAESDEDDDASKWIAKSRALAEEKARAAKREKMLQEMENELGIEEFVKKELKLPRKEYSTKDLKGIEIAHKQDRIKEGQTVVLTLKDQGVLDGGDDVLENVNLVDDERVEKSNFNKKRGVNTYDPYEDAEVDEFGIVHRKNVLSKYDEEIAGPKKESFRVGVNKEERRQQELEAIRNKLQQKQKESLVLPLPELARDYMTADEMASFKKPKKKVRKIRKREMLKADDLLPLDDEPAGGSGDHGSRRQRGARSNGAADDDDAVVGPDVDLSYVKVEDDFSEQRYREKLSKTKNVIRPEEAIQQVVSQIAAIKEEPDEQLESGVAFSSSMVLNATAEFCRTLGTTSLYVSKDDRLDRKPKEEDEIDVEDADAGGVPMDEEAEEEERNRWAEVDPSVQRQRTLTARTEEKVSPKEALPILEEEPNVSQGVAGALELARKKGYIEDESKNKPAAVKKLQDLQAKNYTIEEKYYDEEGRGRRGGAAGHYHGPVSDFKDKAFYKPDVKLDYIDDSGRILSQKEAFRYLSHKFHGKGSGKNKIDKRQKKIEQLNKLEQMSSVDTPLKTLKLLQEKQKQLQTPYIMLSGGAANALTGPSGLSKK
ncbi:hypothetical protein BIW11_13517 [Tropilaelaps mercedesae]|uniref:U4/U6.U5 tri-snRNP-associated protein 1-like n=1 Tax=Tropilaelaps mercedesae TaxID=418985 RepID=A0A1V9X1T3_9ACAR|nr:hypothetical protein BIW11_13517 [Tropilaelaps mercedesae]